MFERDHRFRALNHSFIHSLIFIFCVFMCYQYLDMHSEDNFVYLVLSVFWVWGRAFLIVEPSLSAHLHLLSSTSFAEFCFSRFLPLDREGTLMHSWHILIANIGIFVESNRTRWRPTVMNNLKKIKSQHNKNYSYSQVPNMKFFTIVKTPC